jgi:hypothetical protein
MAAKKRRKAEEGAVNGRLEMPVGKLKLSQPAKENGVGEPQKKEVGDDMEVDGEANGAGGEGGAMPSPESLGPS